MTVRLALSLQDGAGLRSVPRAVYAVGPVRLRRDVQAADLGVQAEPCLVLRHRDALAQPGQLVRVASHHSAVTFASVARLPVTERQPPEDKRVGSPRGCGIRRPLGSP
jgi:hypothetical protein